MDSQAQQLHVPVEVQWHPVSSAAAASATGLLDEAERSRADRFRVEQDRNRFITGRAMLRTALGRAAGCDPAAIRFITGTHGKPIAAGPASGMSANVAHSGDYAVIAVSRARSIGVDVERQRDGIDVALLSRSVFTQGERLHVADAPAGQREAAFFRCWVRKEALLKGLGVGLTVDPRTVECAPAGSGRIGAGWIVHDIAAPDGYAAALAVLA